MTILAYIILVFTLVQLIVSLINLFFETSLPGTIKNPSELVSVLIPARNEENNIGNILQDLHDQDYLNIEIIVFDDQSDDKTPLLVKEFALKDKRVRLLTSEGLPEGWLGKNFACHSLSGHSKGDYLLFLDADVRIKDNIIGEAVSFSKEHSLSLISIFPKQDIRTFGEKITVPVMNYILLSLLPLVLVRKSAFPSLAAANGQFMFFKGSDYHSIEPHRLVRNDKVEDISIARYLKENRFHISCLAGDKDIKCRMYNGFSDASEGFSKNVIAFFGNSFFLAVMFWLITTSGLLVMIFSHSVFFILVYLAAYLLTRTFISVSSHQNLFFNLLFIIPQQFSMGYFIYKAFINKHFKMYQWKGRKIE